MDALTSYLAPLRSQHDPSLATAPTREPADEVRGASASLDCVSPTPFVQDCCTQSSTRYPKKIDLSSGLAWFSTSRSSPFTH